MRKFRSLVWLFALLGLNLWLLAGARAEGSERGSRQDVSQDGGSQKQTEAGEDGVHSAAVSGEEHGTEHGDDTALAGHSLHAEVFNEGPRQAAELIEGTGDIDFPVSTQDPRAQRFFNQGVGQLHGFWYFEAERSFRQAAALDPDAAMFYWGMAMSNLKNPTRALKFVEQAKERWDNATPREKKWIEATERFCTTKDADGKEIPLQKRAQQYTRDLEEVIFLQPDDLEAKAFLVGHLWENQRRELATVSHVAINALLQQIFDVAPMHPAHHYRIHLWDQRDAKQALASAANCGPSAPAIAHMWHMPGHIYSGLHRFEDAVWQMEASARVDHRHMMRYRVLPDQIHNYAHNNEWLSRNLMKVGRVNAALELADNMLSLPRHPQYNTGNKGSGRYGRQRSLGALTSYRMWEELLQRADRMFWDAAAVPERQWEHWQHTGIAAAFLQRDEEMQLAVNSLQAALDERLQRQAAEQEATEQDAAEQDGTGPQSAEKESAEIKAQDNEATAPSKPAASQSKPPRSAEREKARKELQQEIDKLEKALASIQAVQAGAAGRYDEALQSAEKASGLDDLIKAEWLAAAGRWRESWEKVSSEVTKRPNDVVPLAVKVFVAHQWLNREPMEQPESTTGATTGATGEAETPVADEGLAVTLESLREDFESLRRLAGHGDLDAPLLARLANVATQLELAGDWRLPNPQAADVGERPELETLGPAHWTPVSAPPMRVVDADGEEILPLESTGNAKLVMFYLGFGCLHCMEQLQKFSPQNERFAAQGIELLAVSSESLELLQQGLQNYDQPLSFPLYADRELTSFRAFRAYDDFEQQPLHGTFLLGPDGRVLWHDIGHEPFMDVEFLLDEAPRLLQTWSQ